MLGKGCELPKGYSGINGDLHVIFRVKPHDVFSVINSDDIIMNLHVGIADALLGCEKTVKCIDGSEIKMTIPECTKHGHLFVINGKGMPNVQTGQYGNCHVVFNIDMPDKLNDEQKEIIEKVEAINVAYRSKTKIIEKEISTLQEYKTRIISDFVTGKLAVANY